MCTCDFTLSEIDNEEMSIHDVIQAKIGRASCRERVLRLV